MVLEKLGSSLKKALKVVASAVFVDQKTIDKLVKELQRALIEADVDVKLVFELSERIKKKAREKPSAGLNKREQIISLVNKELVNLLGSEKERAELQIKKKPHKIMFVGLYGSGKTTSIAKLALYYSKRGYKVCMLGLDMHRLAACEQLEQLGKKAKIKTFTSKEKQPEKIWKQFKSDIKKFDIAIIDTAGRHDLDKALVKEIKKLHKAIKPNETILSLGADIGQAARKQVESFHKNCNITGIFLTKTDGTAKGGGTLAAAAVTKAPVLFLGIGEKLQDIETFNATQFISRLLGVGDLQALLEKTKLALEEKETEKLQSRLEEGKFTLTDLHDQLKAMRKMGPLSKLTQLIPGFSQIKIPKGLMEVQEEKLKRWGFAIESMCPKERENPEIINASRLNRISKGSAVPVSEIRELLKQYKLVKKFFGITKGKKLGKRELEKLAKKLKLPKGMGF